MEDGGTGMGVMGVQGWGYKDGGLGDGGRGINEEEEKTHQS